MSNNQKDTMNKAKIIYKNIQDTISNYTTHLNSMIADAQTLDLTDNLVLLNFEARYDDHLTDFINVVDSVLQVKRTGVDNALVVRPVSVGDLRTSIWQTYLDETKRYPSRVVCSYDNFVINAVRSGNDIMHYDVLIGSNTHSLSTALELVFSDIGLEPDIATSTVLKLTEQLTTVNYINEICNVNHTEISNYIGDYERIFV